MQTFCTIITADYFPYALALYRSLQKHGAGSTLHILIADNKKIDLHSDLAQGIKLNQAQDLYEYNIIGDLFRKYAHIQMDFFRWAAKPVFLSYLLDNGYEKVIFVDCDIFFFSDYEFLFKELDQAAILLTPHWKTPWPDKNEEDFISLFVNGIYNAGFVGASVKGLPALKWWTEACHYKMGEVPALGIHDDQKYLDALPVLFDDVKVLKHRGCNVATWNFEENKRILQGGKVLINGQFPIVFIHFNHVLAKEIVKGYDKLLLPYWQEYQKTFEEGGYRLSDYMKDLDKHIHSHFFLRLKWKWKIRTRLKRFLYKLAQSL